MMTMMLGRASEAVVEISSRRSAPMSRMDAEEASGVREQAGQCFDLAPAFAFFDLLDAEVVKVIVEHRGAFLRQRRSAIVLLLPHRHAVTADARILQRGRERRAERAQRHELGARQTLAELFEPPVFRNRGNQVERHDRSHRQNGLPLLTIWDRGAFSSFKARAAPYLPLAGRSECGRFGGVGVGHNAPPLRAIPAHSRAWRPPHQDRDEELPGQVTERAEHPRPEAVFFDPWTEPPERACVSLPRHECAVFGGERKYLRE